MFDAGKVAEPRLAVGKDKTTSFGGCVAMIKPWAPRLVAIMLIYPFLQRHFAKGVLIGAVKG